MIIASYANYRNPSLLGDVQSQFLLLDGVVPSSFAPAVAKSLATFGLLNKQDLVGHFSSAEIRLKLQRMQADQNDAVPADDGALNHSMLYFACGHDSSGGKFMYDRRRKLFSYRWKDVLTEPTFLRIGGVMREFADRHRGTFIANPRSTVLGENIPATLPLGGCPMGHDVASGVVNHLAKVFNPKGGFHEGLFVVDASTLPHSMSATPLLTITAFVERIAEKIAHA